MRALATGRLVAMLGFALVLSAVLPRAAGAQLGGDRVEEQLRLTDEALVRAGEVVQEGRSPRARELLERAFAVQDLAWGHFRGGRTLVAGTVTREARLLAARAVSLAREDSSLEQRAERELEKAVSALERARDSMEGAPDEHAQRLLEEARAQIERARAQIQEGHFEVAIRLAVSAQWLIARSAGDGEGHGAESVLRELERTDQLIERVDDLVDESGEEQAARLLEQALQLQRSAREDHSAGRTIVAMAVTRQARDLANRALDLVQGAVDAESVDAALVETESLLQRAAEVVSGAGDERGMELLEKARDHQRRARTAAGEEQFRAALAETRVARSLAKRAMQLVEDGSGE
jgi:tetratricopeptide (TPR) repeat protein